MKLPYGRRKMRVMWWEEKGCERGKERVEISMNAITGKP